MNQFGSQVPIDQISGHQKSLVVVEPSFDPRNMPAVPPVPMVPPMPSKVVSGSVALTPCPHRGGHFMVVEQIPLNCVMPCGVIFAHSLAQAALRHLSSPAPTPHHWQTMATGKRKFSMTESYAETHACHLAAPKPKRMPKPVKVVSNFPKATSKPATQRDLVQEGDGKTHPVCRLVKVSKLIQALDLVHFDDHIDRDWFFDPGPLPALLEIPLPMSGKRIRLVSCLIQGVDIQGVWHETRADILPPVPHLLLPLR